MAPLQYKDATVKGLREIRIMIIKQGLRHA